jgi:hypothetical protein
MFNAGEEQLMAEDLKELGANKYRALIGYFTKSGMWVWSTYRLVKTEFLFNTRWDEFSPLPVISAAIGQVVHMNDVNHLVIWRGDGKILFRGSILELEKARSRLTHVKLAESG